MFWGLIMEPQKRYTQIVKKAFHISMAALDVSTSTDEVVQIMCGYDNRKYLLCTLQKDKVFQCPLDLSFDVDTEVSFITNGSSHVHLSGYLIQEPEDEELFMGEEEEEEEEEEDDEEEEEANISVGNVSTSNIVSGKRSKSSKIEGQLNGLSAKINKKLAAMSKDAPPAKKLKTMDLLQNVELEDDEDDSDVNLSDLLAEDDDDEDIDEDADEEEDAEEEEDGDEEDDDEDEGDEDEEDEEESTDEEVFVKLPPQNGTKKNKKEKEAVPDKKKVAHQQVEKSSPKHQQQQVKSPVKKTIEGGVQIEDIRPGTGAPAKSGKMVQVYYEGRFKTSNKMFDSTTKGPGFKFRLGRGEVIKGWDIGVAGMRIGGKRRIVCPPSMAYGAKGSPPTIPPNTTLVFDVELRNVN